MKGGFQRGKKPVAQLREAAFTLSSGAPAVGGSEAWLDGAISHLYNFASSRRGVA